MLPVGIDESVVIPGLVEGLDQAVRAINADLSEGARVRLRVALHRGLLKPAASGWVGSSAVAVHRILDCGRVREVLEERSNVDWVLAVPDVLYRDVVEQNFGNLRADSFMAATAEVAAKGFEEHVWIRSVPGW